MASDPIPTQEKTVDDLFAQTLTGEIDDEYPWEAVHALRILATKEVFQKAVDFCNSTDPLKKVRGLEIMAQFGRTSDTSGPYFDERISICIRHLSDSDITVVRAAAYAIAHMGSEQCIPELIKLAAHTDTVVREAAAFGLGGQPEAVPCLIKLSEDADNDVRNWATFSLGYITTGDSTDIRAALKRRLDDTFDEVRAEALWGLAIRNDPTGVKMLLNLLESDISVEEGKSDGDLMAAAEALDVPYDTPSTEILDGLRKLLAQLENDKTLR